MVQGPFISEHCSIAHVRGSIADNTLNEPELRSITAHGSVTRLFPSRHTTAFACPAHFSSARKYRHASPGQQPDFLACCCYIRMRSGERLVRLPHVGITLKLLFINSRPFISTSCLQWLPASSRESWRCRLRGAVDRVVYTQAEYGWSSIYRYAGDRSGRMSPPHVIFVGT